VVPVYLYPKAWVVFSNANESRTVFIYLLARTKKVDGIICLRVAVSYLLDLDVLDFHYEIREGLLVCSYPAPDLMLSPSEKIVGNYLHNEMIGTHIRSPHVFDCTLLRKIFCYFCRRSSHLTSWSDILKRSYFKLFRNSILGISVRDIDRVCGWKSIKHTHTLKMFWLLFFIEAIPAVSDLILGIWGLGVANLCNLSWNLGNLSLLVYNTETVFSTYRSSFVEYRS
jgi:hypothetical protein